jgi:hypothetical protein
MGFIASKIIQTGCSSKYLNFLYIRHKMVPMIRRCLQISVWLIIACVSCQPEKETERTYPLPVTSVSEITANGAVLESKIVGSLSGISQYGFIWSVSVVLDMNNGDKAVYSGIPNDGHFIHETGTLISGTPYYARAFVESDGLVVYGNMVTFTVPRADASTDTWIY